MPYVLRLSEETQEQIYGFIEDFVPAGENTATVDAIVMELMKVANNPRKASHPSAAKPCHQFDVTIGGEMFRLRATFIYAADEKHLDLVDSSLLPPWE